MACMLFPFLSRQLASLRSFSPKDVLGVFSPESILGGFPPICKIGGFPPKTSGILGGGVADEWVTQMGNGTRWNVPPRQVRYQAALPDMTNKFDSKVLSNFMTTPNHDFWPRPCTYRAFIPTLVSIIFTLVHLLRGSGETQPPCE
jgi:hypothetical protein